MIVATDANCLTAQAAIQKGADSDGPSSKGHLNSALKVAFTGGAVMGFTVVGLGLAGVSGFFVLMTMGSDQWKGPGGAMDVKNALEVMSAFGFGASAIALFARVAGGIYTKAADVGADLVGKVEQDIPEDDARNPATIADNVGDNVGDVAGMGADLFESYVGSIIAAATLADGDPSMVALPFWIAGSGVLASLMGYFAVGVKNDDATQSQLLHALHKGTIVAGVLICGLSAVCCFLLFGMEGDDTRSEFGWKLFGCIVIGLV
eukprot:SAG22_NODE_7003_length_786_cov_1.344978_1_plen_261_part_11